MMTTATKRDLCLQPTLCSNGQGSTRDSVADDVTPVAAAQPQPPASSPSRDAVLNSLLEKVWHGSSSLKTRMAERQL
jgi:hypothetical protein